MTRKKNIKMNVNLGQQMNPKKKKTIKNTYR